MARTKQKKNIEVNNLPNVFSIKNGSSEEDLKKYLGNANPITLEIGCGHGDYTIQLAKIFPLRNFVGIDIKGARIWVGATKAINEGLTNAAFLLANSNFLSDFFVNTKVEEIIIPFPDPHLRRTSEKRRLVSDVFLDIYRKILIPKGQIHFKTDNDILFNYAFEMLSESAYKIIFSSRNIYKESEIPPIASIQTKYEKHYLSEGRTIKYICFSHNN